MDHKREKNPFFLPALILALLSVVNYFGLRLVHNGSLRDLLMVLELIVPPVALVLSIAVIVSAKKHGDNIGNITVCFSVCSIIVLLFSMFSFAGLYLSGSFHRCPPPMTTQSLTPEESASLESVKEEIERALGK